MYQSSINSENIQDVLTVDGKKVTGKKVTEKSHGKKVTGNKVTGKKVTTIKDQEKIHNLYQYINVIGHDFHIKRKQ